MAMLPFFDPVLISLPLPSPPLPQQHARHIEVQIFGDGQGNIVTFPELECSIQVS